MSLRIHEPFAKDNDSENKGDEPQENPDVLKSVMNGVGSANIAVGS